jgi:hypothetical protein
MANLGLDYIGLCKEVGIYLGLGIDDVSSPAGWATDSENLAFVQECVRVGVRSVYYNDANYEWTFFRPVQSVNVWGTQTAEATDITSLVHAAGSTTITMDTTAWTTGAFNSNMVGHNVVFASGNSYPIATYTSESVIVVTGDASSETGGFTITADGNYNMPSDYAGHAGDLTFGAGNASDYQTVKMGTQYDIRKLRSSMVRIGRPWIGAIEPVTGSYTAEQTFKLSLYPTPDAAYVLSYEGFINPPEPDTTNKYLLGGPLMSEVYRLACLAAAEERQRSDELEYRERFRTALAGAIAKDARTMGPEKLGYNNDPGSERLFVRRTSRFSIYDSAGNDITPRG